LALEESVDAIHGFGGLAIAAHIDRQRFGLLGQLGFIPDGLALDAVEVSGDPSGSWNEFPVLRSSDAHVLCDVGKRSTCFVVEEATFEEIAKALRNEGGRGIIQE
jgi:PHP family Zn ribbon phosphoesterase